MKKLFIIVGGLTTVVALCSFIFVKQKIQQEEALKEQMLNSGKVEKLGKLKIMGIDIEADSIYSPALEALLTDKLTYADVPVEMSARITADKEALSGLSKLELKVQTGGTEITRDIAVEKKDTSAVEGLWTFDAKQLADSIGIEKTMLALKGLRKPEKTSIRIEVSDKSE